MTDDDASYAQEISSPSDELLYRQITKALAGRDGKTPAVHAFGPKDADKGKPSYSRGSRVSAEESFDWHNKNANSESLGVWACSVDEVVECELRAIDDSNLGGGNQAPGHCYIDYTGLLESRQKKEQRDRRSRLYRFAVARDMIYPKSE